MKCCNTCLYCATHERDKCDGCLDPYRPGKEPEHSYHNYVEGNWMKRLAEYEATGRQNIVIGGQGEAEVRVTRSPQETAAALHDVAGQCGYACSSLSGPHEAKTITIHTYEGKYRLTWGENQHLHSIVELLQTDHGKWTIEKSNWPWFPDVWDPREDKGQRDLLPDCFREREVKDDDVTGQG
jgi:hypothetical protein